MESQKEPKENLFYLMNSEKLGGLIDMEKTVSLIMSAYNEEQTVGSVLEKIKKIQWSLTKHS